MNGDAPLRDVLPWLRPRSPELTPFIQTVWYLLWVGIAVLLALYAWRWLRLRRQRHAEFFAAGAEAGLTPKQTGVLFRIARQCRMRDPVRLLRSAHVFDRQVGAIASRLARRDRDHARLATLGRIRTALGFDEIPPDQGLGSTRQVDRGQTVMVESEDGESHAPWLVLERDEGTLTLAPVLRDGAEDELEHSHRPGDQLTVRFWREGDTEYSFETQVVGPSRAAGVALDVEHARLQRRQQRDFYRIDVDFPIDFRLQEPGAGPDDSAGEAAAVDLLHADSGTADDLRLDDEVPPRAGEATSTEDPLEAAPRVHGHVANLSAGGLAVDLEALPETAGPDTVWIVDPAFEGPFPMAGLRCAAVGTEKAVHGVRVKLRFEALPPQAEKAIVRSVYEHQLQAASGRDPEPTAPPPEAAHDDDLPTA